MSLPRPFHRCLIGLFAAGCAALLTSGAAHGQPFEVLQGEQPKKAGRGVNMANGIIDSKEQFQAYYKWFLARFTHPEHLKNLPQLREELKKEFWLLYKGGQGDAYPALRQMVLQFCNVVGRSPKFHPASRVNAVLVLGDLNEQELGIGRPSPPLRAALPGLLARVEEIGDSPADQAVAAAALNGILRHAQHGMRNEDRLATLRAMTALADAAPTTGQDASAQNWLRRRAVEVLGVLGLPGDAPNRAGVVEVLAKILTDRSGDLMLRSAAARSLGQIDLRPALPVDYSQLAHGLAQLAVDLIEKAPSPRELCYGLFSVRSGALGQGTAASGAKRGILVAADDAHQPYVKECEAKLQPLLALLTEQVKADSLQKDAEAHVAELQSWLLDHPPKTAALTARAGQ